MILLSIGEDVEIWEFWCRIVGMWIGINVWKDNLVLLSKGDVFGNLVLFLGNFLRDYKYV